MLGYMDMNDGSSALGRRPKSTAYHQGGFLINNTAIYIRAMVAVRQIARSQVVASLKGKELNFVIVTYESSNIEHSLCG